MSTSVISRFFIDLSHDDNCAAFGKRVYPNKAKKHNCTCQPVAAEPVVEPVDEVYEQPQQFEYFPSSPSWSPTSPTHDAPASPSYSPDAMDTVNDQQAAAFEEGEVYNSPASPSSVGHSKSKLFDVSDACF